MGVNDINFFVKKAVQAITDAVSSVANEVSEKVKPQKSGTNEEDLVDVEKFEIDENLKEQIEYHDNGKPASIVGPIFDENNNIIGKYEAYYYENGNIADEQISEISPDGSYHKRAISYYENGQEAYYENKQFNKDGVLIFDYSEGHTIDGKKKYLYSVENNEYGEMTYTQDEEYDENGNLITSCYADYSREEPFELIKKLKYDKNNNLISEDVKRIDGDNVEDIEKTHFYNDKGQKIKTTSSTSGQFGEIAKSETEYFYKNGVLAKTKERIAENNIENFDTPSYAADKEDVNISDVVTKYDEDGSKKEIETIHYEADGKTQKNSMINKYTYYEGKGFKEIETTFKNWKNEVVSVTTENFSEDGNKESGNISYYNSEGEISQNKQITYKLDEQGKVIGADVVYYEDGKKVATGEMYQSENGGLFEYKDDATPKDGKVDLTEQGGIGDCWLLASLNALNHADPKLLENVISYTEDGSKIKLAVGEYYVSDKELEQRKTQHQYNKSGDDDIIRIEIAMEKALQDYVSGKVKINNPANKFVTGKHEDNTKDEMLIEGGQMAQAFYFLTGNNTSVYEKSQSDLKDFLYLQKLSRDIEKGNVAATVTFPPGFEFNHRGVTDRIYEHHAFTIKDIKNDYVIISNPWDGEEDIKVDMDHFLEQYTNIQTCDAKRNTSLWDKVKSWCKDLLW